jgi:hypothetical protein
MRGSACGTDCLADVGTFVDAQTRLARDEAHLQKGQRNGVFEDSPSGFIVMGLRLEAAQYVRIPTYVALQLP